MVPLRVSALSRAAVRVHQVPPPPMAPPQPPSDDVKEREGVAEKAEDAMLEMLVWCFLGIALVGIPAGVYTLLRSVRAPALPSPPPSAARAPTFTAVSLTHSRWLPAHQCSRSSHQPDTSLGAATSHCCACSAPHSCCTRRHCRSTLPRHASAACSTRALRALRGSPCADERGCHLAADAAH